MSGEKTMRDIPLSSDNFASALCDIKNADDVEFVRHSPLLALSAPCASVIQLPQCFRAELPGTVGRSH